MVAVTTPGYAIPERGARIAGLEPLELPLTAERDFLPDLDAIPLGPPGDPLAQLPEQPDRRDSAGRALRRGGRALPPRGRRARLRRGLRRDLLGRAAGRGAGARTTSSACSSSTRSPSARGSRATAPASSPATPRCSRSCASTARWPARRRPSSSSARPSPPGTTRTHVAERRAVIGRKRAVLREALEAAGFTLAGGEAGLFLLGPRRRRATATRSPGGCSPRASSWCRAATSARAARPGCGSRPPPRRTRVARRRAGSRAKGRRWKS